MNVLSNVNEDSILIFEYFTASGVDDPTIISEAEEIIRSLAIELKDFDVYVLVSKNFENIFEDICKEYDFKIKTVIIDDDSETPLENWLEKNANIFSKSIFIAAENDMNLYNLTTILEKNNVKIYCSNSKAVEIASDKFITFNYLDNKVKQPQTFNIGSKDVLNEVYLFLDKDNLDKMKYNKSSKLIVKPRYGVDCENIKVIESKEDIIIIEDIINQETQYLVQEFIEGIVASVSLICNDDMAIPISLNKQVVEIGKDGGKYIGGEIPFEHPLKEKAFKLAKTACESIKGLKGFVGVDIIINEDENEVYFIEINSRFTTSYVGLQKIANFNIVETIIKLLDNNINEDEIIKNISYNGKVSFLKDDFGVLEIKINNE